MLKIQIKQETLGSEHFLFLLENCTTQQPIAASNVMAESRATKNTFETALSAPV
jgi:hypothetical protein